MLWATSQVSFSSFIFNLQLKPSKLCSSQQNYSEGQRALKAWEKNIFHFEVNCPFKGWFMLLRCTLRVMTRSCDLSYHMFILDDDDTVTSDSKWWRGEIIILDINMSLTTAVRWKRWTNPQTVILVDMCRSDFKGPQNRQSLGDFHFFHGFYFSIFFNIIL